MDDRSPIIRFQILTSTKSSLVTVYVLLVLRCFKLITRQRWVEETRDDGIVFPDLKLRQKCASSFKFELCRLVRPWFHDTILNLRCIIILYF
jgi:hypothetical protein